MSPLLRLKYYYTRSVFWTSFHAPLNVTETTAWRHVQWFVTCQWAFFFPLASCMAYSCRRAAGMGMRCCDRNTRDDSLLQWMPTLVAMVIWHRYSCRLCVENNDLYQCITPIPVDARLFGLRRSYAFFFSEILVVWPAIDFLAPLQILIIEGEGIIALATVPCGAHKLLWVSMFISVSDHRLLIQWLRA